MMNCAPDIAQSSPLLAVRPRTSSLACHAVALAKAGHWSL